MMAVWKERSPRRPGQSGLDDREPSENFGQHISKVSVRLVPWGGCADRHYFARVRVNAGRFSPASDDQVLALQHRECCLHSAEGDAVLISKVLLTWEPLTRGVRAVEDGVPKTVRHLLERLTGVVWINFAHVGQPTQLRQLGELATKYLTTMSMLSSVAVVAAVAADANAPTSAGTPVGATSNPWGETMQVNGTRMFRVKAVAELFDVSVATIYRAIESGKLDALRIGAGKGAIRVPEYAVKAYQEACAAAAQDIGRVGSEVSGEVA
jgi:excisionase family DNA binding protein